MDAERFRRNRWDVICIPESPAGREKVNKIVHGLNSLFALRRIHVRKDHYTLREQIENIGPKMSHDDVAESLFFATRHMLEPNVVIRNNRWEPIQQEVRTRSWIAR